MLLQEGKIKNPTPRLKSNYPPGIHDSGASLWVQIPALHLEVGCLWASDYFPSLCSAKARENGAHLRDLL